MCIRKVQQDYQERVAPIPQSIGAANTLNLECATRPVRPTVESIMHQSLHVRSMRRGAVAVHGYLSTVVEYQCSSLLCSQTQVATQ